MLLLQKMNKSINKIRNYYFPVGQSNDAKTLQQFLGTPSGSQNPKRNLNWNISRVQFQRIRNDIGSWRESATEAENPFYPHRVKMQRLYIDCVNDAHVKACMQRRRNLTLLRDFKICDEKGVPSEILKSYFRNNTETSGTSLNSRSWFDDYLFYTLDAPAFGYSLMSLGDMINYSFPDLALIKRQNISPDRLTVASLIYSLNGEKFMEEPYVDWHIYVTTPNEIASSPCGYGYLYEVAKYEIFVRNNLGYNADFIERFNQPFVKGTTSKSDADERDNFENFLKNSGSSGYIMLDEGEDTVDLVESHNVGTAYQSFDNFEIRNQKLISKCILGHADAMDSTPGKLGGAQDGDQSPAGIALSSIQSVDGNMTQAVTNYQLIPKMRKIGFDIPLNYHFEWLNDDEKTEARINEDKANSTTADIAYKMKQAGLQMDAKYFQERTGIPTTIAPAAPAQPLNNI